MNIELDEAQLEAIDKMSNGCVLCGGVGTGKSRTGIAYYFKQMGGTLNPYSKMTKPCDLYIITTAKKRDSLEWELELLPFEIADDGGIYDIKVKVDSWNNIEKYIDVKNSFFIFDEQRVVGNGAWVKAFLKIAKSNQWILLTATPGDTWTDYIPVFIANGFYRNRTEFYNAHIIWAPTTYPKVDRYINTGRLIRLRNKILVSINFTKSTICHNELISTTYDIKKYKDVFKTRWNPYKDEPIQNAAELCYTLRRIVNSDQSRIDIVKGIVDEKGKAIIFYNYDYELDILRNAWEGTNVGVAEWNGHKHQPIPETERWVYLVQYNAGAEGWNCTKTDCMIFYSLSYSFKALTQAKGRIDRRNTPFEHLWYYSLASKAGIDISIQRALESKKQFNEQKFFRDYFKE